MGIKIFNKLTNVKFAEILSTVLELLNAQTQANRRTVAILLRSSHLYVGRCRKDEQAYVYLVSRHLHD